MNSGTPMTKDEMYTRLHDVYRYRADEAYKLLEDAIVHPVMVYGVHHQALWMSYTDVYGYDLQAADEY